MLSSTVIGVELHRLGLKFNFGQVEVQRGEAELDFNLAEMDLTEVARGGLELKLHEEQHKYIEAKSIEAKLKFNEAKPS